jgi:hypothetical protein
VLKCSVLECARARARALARCHTTPMPAGGWGRPRHKLI